jgi:SagB-type dehydrogenase family enzyme
MKLKEAAMKKMSLLSAVLLSAVLMTFAAMTFAEDLEPIKLLKPQLDKGRPLMQVLKDRSSLRSFSNEKLSRQALSNLLWAAFGVNRADTGKRTAPSAMNKQEIDIYVAMAEGLYLYDARTHSLVPVLAGDMRAMTGRQEYVKDAPVDLIYVADYSKMGPTDREFYSAADTGFIAENVYLYCASEGLATVVRASINRQALAKEMKLRPDQKITLSQSVGHPRLLAGFSGD